MSYVLPYVSVLKNILFLSYISVSLLNDVLSLSNTCILKNALSYLIYPPALNTQYSIKQAFIRERPYLERWPDGDSYFFSLFSRPHTPNSILPGNASYTPPFLLRPISIAYHPLLSARGGGGAFMSVSVFLSGRRRRPSLGNSGVTSAATRP